MTENLVQGAPEIQIPQKPEPMSNAQDV